MTFQRIQKTASTKTEIPTTSQLTSRPFAPITKQTIPTPHQQPEQTQGLIQRKTNLLEIPGLMAAPKKRHEKQEISQTQPKVIQRTTDEEARTNLSGELLEYYEEWLEMTGASSSQEALDVVLGPLTIEELKEKLEAYEERGLSEDDPPNKWESFLPDIIPFATIVDNLLASSPDFGSYIQQRQTEGVNSAENVSVLGESEFFDAFVNELKMNYQLYSGVAEFSEQVNTRLGELSSDENSFDSYFKANTAILREAEGSNGFTSQFFGGTNRAIYLRKSTIDNITETYVHELMHRYSNLNSLELGSSINEGLTDLFMQQILSSLGFPIETKSYAKQIQLVQQLIAVLFDNDYQIFKEAYFQGNIQPVISRISTELQPEEYDILIKGSDVEEQMRILQSMGSEQETNEEIEAAQINEPTSEESEQETDEEIEAAQINEPASEESEQETDEEIETAQINEPTSGKRKRDSSEDSDESEPQTSIRKTRRIEE